MIKHIIWASMIDYPGHTSTVLFTGLCNFNCSYCYNKSLKNNADIDFENEILPKLLERKDFINHVIISGGEPTVDPDFEHIIKILYDNGFAIGVHTNGSNPQIIINNLKYIDFVGIDIKTSKEKYNKSTNINVNIDNIIKTIKTVIDSNINYEIRTTLFPEDVKKDDVLKIAKWLKQNGVKKYHLQQYYAVSTAKVTEQYLQTELEEITNECNNIIETVLKTK